MQFDDFMSQLSETNSNLESFVDFEKVEKHVSVIAIKLNQLNYLIGKDNLEDCIAELFKENAACFSVLNILIAVRDDRTIINSDGNFERLSSYLASPQSIYTYMKETGLAKIFNHKSITNLVDYVFGIEVGLDTNARKNRGGKNMENVVANVFSRNSIAFETEVKHTQFSELESFGEDVKRFDFVIRTKNKTYLIETNFYNGGGSKLNEVARAYTDLAPKINQYENFEFVWITDGQGWFSAKNKLQEAFGKIPKIYNLSSLHTFITIIKAEL